MRSYPNIILVSGAGRESGKTTFICRFINSFSDYGKIVGIKISPHFHDVQKRDNLLINSSELIIEEEINSNNDKDSSRMLKAGAYKVFFVQAQDNFILSAIDFIHKKIEKNIPVIIESGGAAKYIKPGIHIFLFNNPEKKYELSENADYFIPFQDIPDFNMKEIIFTNGKWRKHDQS